MKETLLETTCKGVALNIGKSFAKSKTSLHNFKDKLEELRSLKNDSELFLHEYFLELRNDIDLDREKAKVSIDTHFLGLIDEVDKIEAECKEKSGGIGKEIDIKKFEIDFEKLRANLDVLEIDFDNWESIFYQSNQKVSKLKCLIKDLQNDLLLNKSYKYTNSDGKLDTAIKSSVIVTKMTGKTKHFIEFGSLNFIIDGIKKLSEKAGALTSPKRIFNGSTWYIQIKNKSDLEMGFYLYRESKIGQNDIETSFTLLLLNNDPIKNISVRLAYKFDNGGHGFGVPDFISFKKIFDDDYYDEENDSINLRVDLQFLNI